MALAATAFQAQFSHLQMGMVDTCHQSLPQGGVGRKWVVCENSLLDVMFYGMNLCYMKKEDKL